MKTLTTESPPHLFPGLRVEDRDFIGWPPIPGNKNGVIIKWKASEYVGDPQGGGWVVRGFQMTGV